MQSPSDVQQEPAEHHVPDLLRLLSHMNVTALSLLYSEQAVEWNCCAIYVVIHVDAVTKGPFRPCPERMSRADGWWMKCYLT